MKSAFPLPAEMLSRLDFELAYLSLLTREELKPLSRWEKPFDSTVEEGLRGIGLKTCVVNRSVQTGRPVRELLLSTSEPLLEAYAVHFADSPVRHDPETVRLEGRLFGYPACCVESFARNGYLGNSLRRRDQRILFHWACPNCTITPDLLPDYWRLYRICRARRRGAVRQVLSDVGSALTTLRLRPKVAAALSLAAFGLLPNTTPLAAADSLDPHVTAASLWDDGDADFLTTSEEAALGLNPAVSDQNTNAVPDGVDLALQLSIAVDALPTSTSGSKAFVIHHSANGVEACDVCGTLVDMGFLEIIHPLENQSLSLPYVAKHFLEHGSFSYGGSIHNGRVSPAVLKFLLTSEGRGHFISEPKGTDADQDGLRDWEEPAFGTDPQKSDSDGDLLVDGIDKARELRQALEALPAVWRREDGPKDRPFVVQMPMNGIETCPRCGEVETMGFWEVINPVSGDSVTLPTMALHYLQHGAFGWIGGQLLGGQGRVDPRQLQAVLTGKPNAHLLSLTLDQDGDFLTDQEEVGLGKSVTNPDEDLDRVADGLDLARMVVCEIAGLPVTSDSNQVYREDFQQRGVEPCTVCGTNVNMGYLTVNNPQAHLSVEVPYIALHYLEHDSFSFAGDIHGAGRINVKLILDALFRPAVKVVMDAQQVTLRWMAKAGRIYQVFTAADPQGPWNGGTVFQGDGTEKVFLDSAPAAAAKRFYKVVVR